jgi:ketosteroid isomerase-like protein
MYVKELTEKYFKAWEDADPDAIATLHTEDSVFHLHTAGSEPARGREAVREAFAAMFDQWPDLSFELVSLHVGDEFWAVEWKVRASGFEADLADVVTVEDGLVKSKQSYIDALSVQAQLEAPATPVA